MQQHTKCHEQLYLQLLKNQTKNENFIGNAARWGGAVSGGKK